jgi:DNA-directed RNA polymerase subunit H (RpoH/RPB5)
MSVNKDKSQVSQNKDILQIYKSRNIILELLKNQKYNTNDYDDTGINELFSAYNNNQLDMLLSKLDNSKKVYVKYNLEKLNETIINNYIQDLYLSEEIVLSKNDDLIIIIKNEPNESMMNVLKNIWDKDNIYVNIFNIKRLQYNILNHELVPKHTILTDEEVIEMKKRYNITNDSQLPDISRFDPVGQAICIRPGQICKIERPSRSSITSFFYRICCV